MNDLTKEEKKLLVDLINLAIDQGLIRIQGGVKGALQIYATLDQIVAKLTPQIDGSQVKFPNGSTLNDVMKRPEDEDEKAINN